MIDAVLTNAVSNALHAIFLFMYFMGALVHYLKKDGMFSLSMVLFFLLLFFLKVLGVYVHYYDVYRILSPAWIAISLLIIMLNYLLVQGIRVPEISGIGIIFISVVSSFLFLTREGDFIFIALPVMLVYVIAAFHASGMLRTGFVMIVISNVSWIILRQTGNQVMGYDLPVQFRYDNDLYHLLLILSTFILYSAIAKGGCRSLH